MLSDEHNEVGWFGADELGALLMPEGYRRSVGFWAGLLGDARLAPTRVVIDADEKATAEDGG